MILNSKLRIALMFSFIACFIFIGQSCTKENSEKNETKISAHNGKESHNMSTNCMTCHKKGGEGEGWFNAAGTVYDSTKTTVLANVNVKLYSGPNGTGDLKHTIQVDALGNFYTTEAIDFTSGLFPAVEGPTGTQYMSTATNTGQCYSCHNVTTDKIWTK
jgi:cytochrome c553